MSVGAQVQIIMWIIIVYTEPHKFYFFLTRWLFSCVNSMAFLCMPFAQNEFNLKHNRYLHSFSPARTVLQTIVVFVWNYICLHCMYSFVCKLNRTLNGERGRKSCSSLLIKLIFENYILNHYSPTRLGWLHTRHFGDRDRTSFFVVATIVS